MKILALDSSGLVASVALVEDDVLIAEYTTDYKKTHSQTLLPMLDEIRKMVDLDLSSVDLIAAAAGPGSFTGLRIGSATAKGLGLALNKPLAAIPTVDALAWNLYGCDKVICPMMDARRSQVYTGLYTFERIKETMQFQVIKKQCAMPVEELINELNTLGKEVIFLGDGVPVYEKQIRSGVQVPYSFAPAGCNRQRAATIAMLGAEYAKEGALISAGDFTPEYLRMSQAERERMEASEAEKERMKAGITPASAHTAGE
ncbi:MAG: tRNA (adenosine(37)-N6)-threonylcarbamoyltransferase complex dimerization subunit type 1 TsaB [Lachnospiraceae bacterium]|nr:tRNA (adenosine(37)-N6)-threonylcarbamoyltransferase complex dimerization subunit type 1 TsaB [Lachnospiraceae bacterium]